VIPTASESSKSSESLVPFSVRDEPPRGVGYEWAYYRDEYRDDEEKGERNLIAVSPWDRLSVVVDDGANCGAK